MRTPITALLGCEHAIIQAPMAGGGDTPALVAASANAGAFGFIGAAYLTADQVSEAARAVRALTPRPFGINLFAPTPREDGDVEAARARLQPYYAEFGMTVPLYRAPEDLLAALIDAALARDVRAISFTLG